MPPCEAETEPWCKIIDAHLETLPFKLLWSNQIVWDIYQTTIAISSRDMSGLPQLDKLEFVLQMKGISLEKEESNLLLKKILLIHREITAYYHSQISSK